MFCSSMFRTSQWMNQLLYQAKIQSRVIPTIATERLNDISAKTSAKILQIATALLWALPFCFTDFAFTNLKDERFIRCDPLFFYKKNSISLKFEPRSNSI